MPGLKNYTASSSPFAKRIIGCFLLMFFVVLVAKADHITGGEMFYTALPGNNGTIQYSVTLKLFMRCNSGREFNNPAVVSIFDRATNTRVRNVDVSLTSQRTISLSDAGPCVTNPPVVCYVIGTYEFVVSLEPSLGGYLLSSQVNFRISGIANLEQGYRNIGATYTAEIPGTSLVANAPLNNGALFTGSDLVVVCAKNRFAYSFAASDADGDELRYSFCYAYVSGATSFNNNSVPPPEPPYASVQYDAAFSGFSPLGKDVVINSKTGLITGTAPSTGVYVVTVCVEEIRNGMVIATQRKDLQITIAACDIAAAILPSEYQLCRTSKTLQLANISLNSLIKTQHWEILNSAGTTIFKTTGNNIPYTFADTGLYTIKLIINKGQVCTDSAASLARVYPGFRPSFNYAGLCFTRPTVFSNNSTTLYGAIGSYKWDFGDLIIDSDTSLATNPSYTYNSTGSKLAVMTAYNTNGCTDTAVRIIPVFEKPPLKMAFQDTLICISDSVTLLANGNGNVQWAPLQTIVNSTTAQPTVFPTTSRWYYATLNDQGCINTDSVYVRVTDKVNLITMADTIICQGDTLQLKVLSDGLNYSWTPASNFINPFTANPIAITSSTTLYQVTANIGSCIAKKQLRVLTAPYPYVNAGADTMLCFNTKGQLNGSTNGSSFKWSPSIYVSNSNVLNPAIFPSKNTKFALTAYDNKGCPKAGIDSIMVMVLPNINAFAGNDTAIILGQDLQLNATGGTNYVWSPNDGLSAPNISNPIARFGEPIQGIRYQVSVYNQAGCVDTASFFLKVFSTLPTVFVPSAFTPNNDGKNDLLRPIGAGIKSLEDFSVYNRWGRLVFSTRQNTKGWDGTISGVPQGTGTFIWSVKAIDYLGNVYNKQGTVVLLR